MCVLRLFCDGVEAHEELVQRLEQLLRLLCDRVASLRGLKAVLRSLFRAPRLNARAVKTGNAAEGGGGRRSRACPLERWLEEISPSSLSRLRAARCGGERRGEIWGDLPRLGSVLPGAGRDGGRYGEIFRV